MRNLTATKEYNNNNTVELDEDVSMALHNYLSVHFPDLAGIKIEHEWAGIMGFSTDRNPLIGEKSLPIYCTLIPVYLYIVTYTYMHIYCFYHCAFIYLYIHMYMYIYRICERNNTPEAVHYSRIYRSRDANCLLSSLRIGRFDMWTERP